jgi:hypothetical protein
MRNFSANEPVRSFSRRFLGAAAIFCLLPLLSPGPAMATIVTYAMNTEFSGGTAPSASAPWVVVTINDFNLTGMVNLKISNPGLTGNENVEELMLNLDPALDPTDLLFSAPTKSRAFDSPVIGTGLNAFKADGDGRYDILLDFTNGGPPNTFLGGDSIEYTITGIGTLDALSFFYLSDPAGGYGPYTSAAHVQNTGGGGFSGWITDGTNGSSIPEPASAVLLLMGAVSLLGYRFRRRKRS